MAGIYVHIPFCRSRCVYCGFYSTVGMELRDSYVDAVCREWQLRRGELALLSGMSGQQSVETVYLGGGTPSQLTGEQLQRLFSVLPAAAAKEVTIEVNPDDVTAGFAELLSQLPVNRVSMGAQTFDDRRLRFLHRRHTAGQVPEAVRRLRDAGIRNISVDLMYGFPEETLDDWSRDVEAALALHVEHLSAYCLMIEEDTPLCRMGVEPADEETERQMYELLIDRLASAGYEHYEISNFARPGYRSLHNSGYWRDVPYIGLGAAAHSYDGAGRQWNVSDLRRYIDAVSHDEIPCERETLDADTRYNDRITVALRTREGLDLTVLSDRHRRHCLQEARRFLDDGLLQLADGHLSLTRRGLFVSDMVMSALMLV